MEIFDDDDKKGEVAGGGEAETNGAEVGDGVAAGDGGTASNGTFDPTVTTEYRRGFVLGDSRPAERGEPGREPTFVSLENVDQTVGEIIGWLKGDINKFNDKFLDVDEDDDALFKLIDDQFVDTCKEIIAGIISGRQKLAFTKGDYLREDDCVLLINEMFRTLLFHRHHVREDGSSYFYSHLIGAVKISIAQNFVGLRGILGTLKHDDLEDVEGVSEEDVLDFDLYGDRLELYDEGVMKELKRVVVVMARGLKKVKNRNVKEAEREFGVKFEDGHEATFFTLLFMMIKEEGARTVVTKLCDKAHNMKTIEGHENHEKRKSKARETREVYLPFARVFRIRGIIRDFVDCCVKVLNPDLYADFYDFVRKRTERVLPFKRDVDSLIRGLGFCVKKVEFVSAELHEYTKRSEKPLGDIKFEDFKIDVLNPMQEIAVIVDDPVSMDSVKNAVSVAFDFSEQEVFDNSKLPVKAIEAPLFTADGGVVAAFPESGRMGTEEDISFVPLGVTIKGYSRKFNQLVVIRINDEVSEQRTKRGVFAENKGIILPDSALRVIKDLVRGKLDGTIPNILVAAKREFLRPKTYFKTPHDELCSLPQGSTYLDAASVVDSKRFLIGMRGVRSSYSNVSGRHGGSIDFFDEIPVSIDTEAPMFTFDSSLVGLEGESARVALSKVSVGPAWLKFCYTKKAREEVLKYLKDPFAYFGIPGSGQDAQGMISWRGKEYADRLSRLFGMKEGKIRKKIKDLLVAGSGDMYRAIGSGEVDPFSRLVDCIQPMVSWIVKVDVANRAGVIRDEIWSYFAPGLSIRPVGGKKSSTGADVFMFSVESVAGGVVDNETFFKILLKLSYKHDVKLVV